MKYISTKSIDAGDFRNDTFVLYDSIESIVDNNENAKNLYILKVEEEDNPAYNFLMKSNILKRKGRFKNHHMDSVGKIIKILDKATLKEMNEAGASSEYFYRYAITNVARLEDNSLNTIVGFLIEKNIEPELLISFCAKIKKLSNREISLVEDYIYSKIIDINMIIEFANKVKNCNVNKLVDYVLEYYSDDESLILFINSVDSCNMDKIIRYIIQKDTCPRLSHAFKCLDSITNRNFDFKIVEDAVIEKDRKGKQILKIAKEFNNVADVNKLAKAIVNVDDQGFMSLRFLYEINGVDTNFLEEEISKKDKMGVFCRELAMRPGANLELLTNRIIELNNKNKGILLSFVETIDKNPRAGRYQELLLKSLIDNGGTAEEIYKFLTTASQLGSIAKQLAVDTIKMRENNSEAMEKIKVHTILSPYLTA
jgi:hypothetical protein